MRQPIRFRDRIHYAVDTAFARGSGALVFWLFVASGSIVLLGAVAVSLLGILPPGETSMGFAEATWASLMRALDPGTVGGDEGWAFRLLMLTVTIGGIFVLSTLIGVLSSGIDTRLAEMRKGRSKVIERDHTVILGWSPQVFTIIAELVEANRNRHRPAIVVLAPQDKVAMEEAIDDKIGRLRNTRVICRTGNPLNPADLDIAGIDRSRAIILLTMSQANPDAEAIKAILAITRRPERRAQPYHIVAEIRDAKNTAAARVAGGKEVELLVVGEVIARLVAQTCRQVGLSIVYSELLNFAGDEIYFGHLPKLTGQRFGEALLAFESAAVIGLQIDGQAPLLCPGMDRIIGPEDRIIAIAEDDDRIIRTEGQLPPIDLQAIAADEPETALPESTLILGWNWRGASITRELDHYVPADSGLTIVASMNIEQVERSAIETDLMMQDVSFHKADITDRDVLDRVMRGHFDHVVVLSEDSVNAQAADARTLMTLLHLRDIAEKQGTRFSTVTEILDSRNQQLAEITGADDFIVSDLLISQVLAQISENRDLAPVLADLFDHEACEIQLEPAARLVVPDQEINFATLVAAARERGKIAIGYRLADPDAQTELGHGVVINPAKSSRIRLGQRDWVILMAAN